jgi:UDP-N-acetylmuramate--alanine ligase
MNLQAVTYVYFLGAGGIGMSALGRYFLRRGIAVGGYDKTATSLTSELIAEGMNIGFIDSVQELPTDLTSISDKSQVLVIYTPAIPANSEQLNYFRSQGYSLIKRAEVLGLISRNHKTLAVAGTHGKTTTSTLIAHLLEQGGMHPVAFLGGISVNYNSNYLPGTTSSILVAEADEYDRSFLHLHPHTAVITSTDADHLDIYGKKDALVQSFSDFADQVDTAGNLILKAGLDLPKRLYDRAITYHTELPADVRLENCVAEGDKYRFDVRIQGHLLSGLTLGLPGFHNVENALAAIASVYLNGLSEASIRNGLESFRGVKRRFEYILRENDFVFIDDYAHHPEELRACITSVKRIYPGRHLMGVFQPHLFTRTRDFLDGFAESLSLLDEVILLDIYPARELPIEGVNSAVLLDKITSAKKSLLSKDELAAYIASHKPEVLLTLGAGDIDMLVEPIRQRLTQTPVLP